MATIATLKVNMVAKSKAFTKSIKLAQRALTTFGNVAKVSLAAGTVAALGLAYMVKQQMATIDATAKMADRLEMATEDIIALRYQAEIMGATAEGLDKSLQMFVRRLGEVRMGSGEAKDGLEALGITADALVGIDTMTALMRVADGIAGIEKAADKAAVAYKLFGRGGTQLLNMLALGSEGIERFRAEAEKLGLLYTREQAARVEAANDAMTRLKKVLTGLAQTLTIELAPTIENAANLLTHLASKGEGLGATMINSFEAMSLAAAHFVDFLQDIKYAYRILEVMGRIPTWKNLMWRYHPAKEIVDLYKALKGVEIPGTAAHKLVNDMMNIDKLSERIKRTAEVLRKSFETKEPLRNLRNINAEFDKTLNTIIAANLKLQEQVEFFGLADWDLQIAKFQKMAESLAGDELAIFNTQIEAMIGLADELKSKNAMAEMAEAATKSFDTLKSKIESIRESIKTPIEQLADFGWTLAEGIKEGLLSLVEARLALRQRVEDLFGITPSPYTGSIGGMKPISPRYEFATGMPTQNINIWQDMRNQLREANQLARRTADNTGDIAEGL